MLAGGDRLARIRELLAQRAGAYAALPHHLDTTHLSIPAAAERVLGIAAGLPEGGHRLIVDCELQTLRLDGRSGIVELRSIIAIAIRNPQLRRPHRRGLLAQAGQRIVAAGLKPGRCAVITNPTVGGHHCTR